MLAKPASLCAGCPLYDGDLGKTLGFSVPRGNGSSGVLLVAEALGAEEELVGSPLVGPSGQYLWSNLQRIGIEQEQFTIHNVIACRPPENILAKAPYEDACIAKCSPYLDTIIAEARSKAQQCGKTFVMVALGRIAFKRLLGLSDRDAVLRDDWTTYPHWSDRYQCNVLGTYHPSYLLRGKHNLAPVMRYTIQRALEIASEGLQVERPRYLLDPSVEDFHRWAEGYLEAQRANPQETFLSFDIETPYKSGMDESEIAREDDDDYTILRCSFSYKSGDAVSVPWQPEYTPTIERLFGVDGAYLISWNGEVYDLPRIVQYMQVRGVSLDAMLAWHVLNTSMPKGLGFVTPFYWKNTKMWKHMAQIKGEEAFYNAKDADAALRCWLGIRQDLKDNGLWGVFEEHVVRLNEVLSYMSRQGVLLDQDARKAAETQLAGLLVDIDGRIQAAVPQQARQHKVFKKEPKDVAGLVRVAGLQKTTRCPQCSAEGIKAVHFKSVGKKALKKGSEENPCVGRKADKVEVDSQLWAQPLPFKLSNTGLKRYQGVMGHKPVVDRKKKTITFDVKALKTLRKNYPSDPLYAIIGEYRGVQKLLGNYVGVDSIKTVVVPDNYQLKDGEQWIEADQ